MTSENPTADRLVNDARKKNASHESPLLAQIAIGLGVLGLLGAWFVPISGWVLGALAAGMGGVSLKRGTAVKFAQIALAVGVLAILLGVFRFSLYMVSGA